MRCVAVIGDLIAHSRHQLERSPIAKFGIEFAFEYVQRGAAVPIRVANVAAGVESLLASDDARAASGRAFVQRHLHDRGLDLPPRNSKPDPALAPSGHKITQYRQCIIDTGLGGTEVLKNLNCQ